MQRSPCARVTPRRCRGFVCSGRATNDCLCLPLNIKRSAGFHPRCPRCGFPPAREFQEACVTPGGGKRLSGEASQKSPGGFESRRGKERPCVFRHDPRSPGSINPRVSVMSAVRTTRRALLPYQLPPETSRRPSSRREGHSPFRPVRAFSPPGDQPDKVAPRKTTFGGDDDPGASLLRLPACRSLPVRAPRSRPRSSRRWCRSG